MTILLNTTLLCFALLCNFSSSHSSPPLQVANQYCNSQYHFCAKYPSSILPFQSPLIQGDGIKLTSKDGFSEVVIGAFAQAADATTKSIFFASAREKSAERKEPKIVNSIFGEDYYECFFMVDHHYYYHKSFHFEDHFVRLEIKVPLNMPDRMVILRGQTGLDFQVEEILEDSKEDGRELGSVGGLKK